MKTKGNGWTKKPELRRISSQPRYGRFDTALHFIRFAAVLAGKLIYYSRFLRKNQAEILNFRRKYRAVRARRENAALPCASGRKAPGIMRSSFLPGSGRDADVQGGGGRTSLMTGAAYVSKERVPASLRIRLSEALAKAGRTFLFSESSRDPRPDPQAAANGLPVPVIEIARKPETPKTDRMRPYRQSFRALGNL